eukprot:gene34308-biopygen7837
MDGMEVKNITSEKVVDARKGVVEFLLLNHPLDCPVCDQAGECDLQNLSYEHGTEATRYEFKRRTFEKEDIGPYISLHMNRCIMCFRCVFTADQLTERREHGILDRGDHAQISTMLGKALDNDFIGNVIDVCPVGALTDKTFRFKNRVWFTKPVDAHRDCPTCSGKARLWMRGEEVFRVTARKDQWGEVEEWICNDCRFHKKEASDWAVEVILMGSLGIAMYATWGERKVADINIGILFVFGVVSLGVYGIMLGGWASNNKFSLLSSIRAASQAISYELAMGISLIALLMMTGSLSLRDIVQQQHGFWADGYFTWNVFKQPLGFIIFL